VDDFDEALPRARALVYRFEEEPHVNPNTGTAEFSLCLYSLGLMGPLDMPPSAKLANPNPAHCLNCSTTLLAGDRFCGKCGQRADVARLSFTELIREFLHAFDTNERGPLSFSWALLTRPGVVAREYVEGRRRRYYGPFGTLATVIGLTALILQVSGFRVLAQDGLTDDTVRIFERHFNLLLLVQMPLLGVAASILFRRTQQTLPEHMALAAYALSVRATALLLLILLAWSQSLHAPSVPQTYAFWIVWYVYYGWTASQFYRGSRVSLWFKGMVTAIAAHAATMTVLLAMTRVLEVMASR
jgi:hypothetical protein